MKFVNKKLVLCLIFSLFFVTGFLAFNSLVHAQASNLDVGLKEAAATGLPTTDIRTIVAKIIKAALGLLGIVALCLILYAGYLWMTAGGDDEKVATSKKILINATIGLVIILSAYAIVSFVMNKLVEATTGNVSSALCEAQKANGGASCGGDCPSCFSSCAYDNCASGQFAIVQMPATGNVCVQNVAPVIVFNLDVDVDSLKDRIVVENASTSVPVVGEWSIQTSHHHIAYFKPTNGVCPTPDTGKDCFAASTTYKIKIKDGGKGIQSAGGKDLNCIFSTGKCADVNFTSGDGVDRKNPVINILYPKNSDTNLKQGDNISVKVHFEDDGGLQNIVLNSDGMLVDSVPFSGCKKSDTATIIWPTNKLNIGEHSLKAIGLDWAANSNEDNSTVVLKPKHCFDLTLDPGEKFIDCGGECGVCSGDKCTKDVDCYSGFCQKQNAGDSEGTCVEKTYITDFSPSSAAVGDYISIFGKNFGGTKGHVYFAKVPNPDVKQPTDWVEAQVVNCGASFNNWSDNQIIVLVPENIISGKIAVFSPNAIGSDVFNIKYFDTTGDGFKKVSNFTLTNISHPGICGLNPNNGSVGTSITVKGKNFGAFDVVKSFVTFSDKTKTKIEGWADDTILSVAPTSLGNGNYGVKVTNSNNQTSNSVLFTISGSNQDAPLISEISAPAITTIGDYLTITGKNFGNQIGSVWFKLNGAAAPDGVFNFPVACKNSFWKDNQIVVKVPPGLDTNSKRYTIQVYNSVSELGSVLDDNKFVMINTGDPSPGICKISPVSGAVPFVFPNTVTVSGEYLDKVTKFYFWKTGGASNDILNTLIGNSVTNVSAQSFSSVPNDKNITSGLVFAYRGSDKKQSNGLLFSTSDCTKNDCVSNSDKCCKTGDEAGMCKPKGELCKGEFKSSGFVWMFSTKEIVPPPQVIERCDHNTELGKNLPSPSPSTKWNEGGSNDASKVCQTALVTVEFSADLNPATVNNNSVTINACESIDVDGVCQKAKNILLTDDSYKLNSAAVDASQNARPYLLIKSQDGKWASSTLFQVVLKDSISSVPDKKGQSVKLVASNPCGVGTAYCFSFKTGIGDCALKKVVVTPNEFWAKILESPMRYHSTGGDVFDIFYKGNGLSTQYCTMMDVSGFDWKWVVDNKNAGKIYATIDGAGDKINTQVNTLGNTVGVGVANDSVDVKATASTSSVDKIFVSKTGSSPLTIDLSNPEVVDYWPNCLEACTNASVGAKFNITMSNHNVTKDSPAIKLVQCNDENCFSTSEPVALDSSFDEASGHTILKIANDKGSESLKPNTLYQVMLSSVSASGVDNGAQLWSVAFSNDPESFSKPYNKIFTWRFRTKKEACKVDHVSILPKVFTAKKLKDLAIFQAQPFAAPDACSVTGQKLNPWNQNWSWSSSDVGVATVQSFKTKGSSAFCTANCILKGSTVPSGQGSAAYPVCGNGKVEAGEDCDPPLKLKGCGLNCRFIGNPNATTTISKVDVGLCGDGFVTQEKGEACDINDPKSKEGCNTFCLHTGSKMQTAAKEVSASICGNGMIGSGEDCDVGVSADQNVSTSSILCSAQCLHLGTRLSSQWCFANDAKIAPAFGGFEQKDYNFFCSQSYSQCGDGVTSPDEDVGCETTNGIPNGKHSDWCNDRCLVANKSNFDQNLTNPDTTCSANKEGCDENAQHVGSSLMYSKPSVCGDGVVGVGEDEICETDKYLTNIWHKDLVDPWVLAIGQAGSVGNIVSSTLSAQVSDIKGAITDKNVSGIGKYQVLCGYKTDEQCQEAYKGDKNVGVGLNSCCYFKSKLIDVYPGNTSTDPGKFATNVCINTFISASFDSIIDPATLPGNFVIARSAASPCSGGLEDVHETTSFLASSDSLLPWYQNIWNKIIITIKSIFGNKVTANTWCAGADIGGVEVVRDDTGGSQVLFSLNNPLAPSTEYVVILKKGIKNIQGVSIESKSDGKAVGWRFKTGKTICAISDVSIDPDQYYFSVPNADASLVAKGVTENLQLIQPVSGYSWEYQWGPKNNPYVLISGATSSVNIITSQNNNGEVDVHAAANLTENTYTPQTGLVGTGKSHIIVFLCENPWPPKQAIVQGQTKPTIIFPYEDKVGNNDGFDLDKNIFDSTEIPAANVGKGYFNFSTYYCADNGDHGYTDDLPYLRPVVQTGDTVATKSGVCDLDGLHCNSDTDCKDFYKFSSGDGKSFFSSSYYAVTCAYYDSDKLDNVFYVDSNKNPMYCSGWSCPDSGSADYLAWKNSHDSASCLGTNGSQTKQTCTKSAVSFFQDSEVFKRFIFTNNKNNDAIGIQVLSNKAHLSPSDWFTKAKGFAPTVQNLPPIDGYPAISDGSNIYVNALNFDSTGLIGHGNLETNIYLFSINENAAPETRKVFENLIKNLKFNINLTNYGYCGKDMKNPGDTTVCISDFDCANGEVCSVQKDKIKRNFSRIQDMSTIEKDLLDYSSGHGNTYPDLKVGSYLSGQTVSTWPSWSTLTGTAIPADPINKLGVAGTCASSTGIFCIDDKTCQTKTGSQTETCVLHAPDTGWSTADKRFSFACANNSLAYRYFATSTDPKTPGYLVKLRMEDSGLVIDNLGNLVKDLITKPAYFNILDTSGNGICNQNNEISTMNQGTCGDGKVNLNKGEECDPKGSVVWNQADCVGGSFADDLKGDICSSDCKWSKNATTTKCGILSKCGNGKVEVGETCDEGALNGKYNHCNPTCSGLSSSCGNGDVDTKGNEVCDTNFDFYKAGKDKDLGWCASGVVGAKPCNVDDDCKIQQNLWGSFKDNALVGIVGKCIQVSFNNSRYGLTPTTSCNLDCQAHGPYCGDAIVQKDFGEECDGNKVDTISGVTCNRVCGSGCRWVYNSVTTSPILYFNFDDVITYHAGWPKYETGNIGGLSYILNKGQAKSGISLLNSAYCSGVANTGCPTPISSFNGDKNQAMHFNGISNYFTIDHSASFDVNELTFATWINVDGDSSDGYHAVISKQEGKAISNNRDYNFYIVKSGNKINLLHFYSGPPPGSKTDNIFGISSVPVDLSVGVWYFVAVTVDAQRQVKYYVDGQYKGTGVVNGSTKLKADNNYPIWIGRADNWFKGSMDEMHLFGRTLTAGEITDLYNNGENFCQAKIATAEEVKPTTETGCGNGKIETGEACDNGNKNGVACTSGYNKPCVYCSWDCKNNISVDASGYCGDGVINGTEKCEVSGNSLYSSVTSTYITNDWWNKLVLEKHPDQNGYIVLPCDQEYNLHLNSGSLQFYKDKTWTNLTTQIGIKTCINNCSSISNKCVECGLKTGGSPISGALINVLEPLSNNPLLSNNSEDGDVGLLYVSTTQSLSSIGDTTGVAFFSYKLNDNIFDYKLHPYLGDQSVVASINSDPVCSDKSQSKIYRLAINSDFATEHMIDFPVFGTTTPDKYNLLLSPVIFDDTRPQDVRVVVSWVGDVGFNTGFLVPGGVNSQTGIITSLEDNSPAINISTGINYYTAPNINPLASIWYHGFKNTNTSNVKSFTIDTSKMVTSSYAFYIKTADTMKNLKNSAKLKVEVYVPESDDNLRHFARPAKTYYLNQAIPSDNDAAQFWHVFNIKKAPDSVVAKIPNRIGEINMIRSFIKMNYAP
ncbi:MAG: LamG-like jellyroll fold domain-containing protein [Candidatus Magasanikbacteria bacterium]